MTTIYDLVIIGGGINGCGIARDAAGRGLKVLLVEKGDLAQSTSSASSKLIHGGLRYLEYYEFGLVRKALTEREVLLKIAPHIIWPMRFVLPHHRALRPAWLLRLGLLLYDYIGGRKRLPPTKSLNLRTHITGEPLCDRFQKGFEYSDCGVDDARLVLLNALDAAYRGADIKTRTQCVAANRKKGEWQVTLQDSHTKQTQSVQARAVVNAAGPWVDLLLETIGTTDTNTANIRLVRGSHIVVPKLYQHDRAYIFQNADNRILFAIPYQQDYTLLGTTDEDHHASPEQIDISLEETRYICESASVYFKKPVREEDVIWHFSGVRSLYNDNASSAQAATRDYVLSVEDEDGQLPLLNIFGGKITTYRHLAEDVLDKLQPYLHNANPDWTGHEPLPGGNFDFDALDDQITRLQHDYAFVDVGWARSLIHRYGTRAWDMLGDAQQIEDMGQSFGATLTVREVEFLMQEEWAQQTDDILWRRSKLGLHMSEDQINAFDRWMNQRRKS